MIIAVNGIYLNNNAVGIANLIIKTINYLAQYDDIKIILYTNKPILPVIKERLVLSRVETIVIPLKYIPNKASLWFFFKFPYIIRNAMPDILWCPTPLLPWFIPKNQKVLLTVHDFVSRDFRHTMRFFNRLISDILEKGSIKRANIFWCVSKYTKNLLNSYYPYTKTKKIFVGNGVDDFYAKKIIKNDEKKRIYKKFDIEKDFILFVGTLEPRKNLKFLLDVFAAFNNRNIQLVVVGAKGWGKTEIADIVNNKEFPREDVIFTGYVTDDELVLLYNCALCYISTALNEGFGLPQVEAMACGCPVISPHNSAMIEVVDGAGVSVHGWEISNWVEAINFTISNRDEIVSSQNNRLKLFQWETIMKDLYTFLFLQDI